MNKLSFKTKILLMLATALAALLLMAGLSLLQERRLIVQARQDTLATAVQAAHSIVMAYKERADSGALPLAGFQRSVGHDEMRGDAELGSGLAGMRSNVGNKTFASLGGRHG